jgi:hypothetical protein
MRPSEILSHLRKQPFEPFRLFLSDGGKYDVRHPELALVSPHTVVVGLEPLRDDMPHRLAYCDPIHVVRIEPLNGAKRGRRRKGTRK